MIEVLKNGAYTGTQPVLIGNSLDIMSEFLAVRSDRLDRLIGGMC